jgi:aryl-alcohol dehydrogenase-like predicted oxidoreductase
MSFVYASFGGYDNEEPLQVLTQTANMGITFWDTNDIYRTGKNKKLIGRWFKETGHRKEIFLATKFSNLRGSDGSFQVQGDKEWMHQTCTTSVPTICTWSSYSPRQQRRRAIHQVSWH